MIEPTILTNIAFHADVEQLRKRLRIDEAGEDAEQLDDLVRQAHSIARPRAVYRPAFVDQKGDSYVVIDGIKLTSRVLRVNLGDSQRVFPYVVTSGVEMEEWSNSIDDVLLRYWADAIRESALRAAMLAMDAHMTSTLRLGATARMNPGSLADWPISEQRPLFALLGNPEEQIGVRLTDSYLMLPIKSTSGLRYPTEESFESCQLCPRELCPNRRAPYDSGLFERKYSQ